jgi:hypothetical protein
VAGFFIRGRMAGMDSYAFKWALLIGSLAWSLLIVRLFAAAYRRRWRFSLLEMLTAFTVLAAVLGAAVYVAKL